MARLRTALLVASLAIAGTAGTVITAQVAAADVTMCEQFANTTAGQYIVQNNRWGTSATQCITATSNGFRIIQQDGSNPTNGAPVSYPSIFAGCHYTLCTPGTNMPRQVSQIGSVPSSINYTFVGGSVFNASYDIWLDPTPRTNGVNQTEIMIWFNRVGPIQPIGSVTDSISIGGRSWQVWTGSNGSNNVVSYVAPSAISSWSFDILPFISDTINRGYATRSWYLTSVQAGFEPWSGGVGLAVNSFSAAVNLGTPPTNPTTPPTGGPAGACRVTYGTNVWPGGFTANVTVANTGGVPVNGWALAFALPSGQSITDSWNASLSGGSGSVTAHNVSYNATIPVGGSQSFGFQGTYGGSFVRPSSFALNGTACSVA